MAKDLFSPQAGAYAKFRPVYPRALYNYIFSFVQAFDRAWDCATGNGQAAVALADYFTSVEATDISEAQLGKALQKANVTYRAAPAEHTPFAPKSFDLVTVAQAYHWLDWNAFQKEAERVGKPGCVVAVWGYNLVRCAEDAVNAVVDEFYFETVHACWDAERRYVDEEYRNVDFSFEPLPSQNFSHDVKWQRDHLLCYISTWSAVQHYQNKHNASPLPLLAEKLLAAWPGDESKAFSFPLFLRLGRTPS